MLIKSIFYRNNQATIIGNLCLFALFKGLIGEAESRLTTSTVRNTIALLSILTDFA